MKVKLCGEINICYEVPRFCEAVVIKFGLKLFDNLVIRSISVFPSLKLN